jgi:hypothetical protein
LKFGGSFSRDTFIRGGSDVDFFAVISRKDVTSHCLYGLVARRKNGNFAMLGEANKRLT